MKKNIIKTFSFMFSAMFFAKVLGLLRDIVFAYFYGTGYKATAFLTASTIPLQLLDISLGAAVSSTFIPIFNENLQKYGKKKAIEFANNFLNIIIVISLILTILGVVFAPQIVAIIAPELEATAVELTVNLTKILFPIMVLTAVAYVFVGFLQSLDEFNIPAIISVVANGILILYMMIFNDKFGIYGVAVAMLIGWSTQILIQLPAAIKKGFRYKFILDLKDENIKKIVKMALPILISTWVQPINNLVNLRLASGLENGQAVSSIQYSYKLYLIIVGVFSYTLSNIIFPELSKLTADKNIDKIKVILNKSIRISLLFIIPMTVGIALLSNDIVKAIYERGEFTPESTKLTGEALKFYAIGMIGYGLMEVLNKAFYAMQDSKTPMKISLIAIFFNVLLSITCVHYIGYVGLPLAASLTSIITGIIMILVINRKLNGIVDKSFGIEFLKIMLSAFFMGIIILALNKINISNSIVNLLICVIIGVIIYFGTIIALDTETVSSYIQKLKIKK